MQNRDTLKRHAALVDRMATVLGIDLEEAALAGRLRFDEIADAVLRCTGCSGARSYAGSCEGSAAGPVGAVAAPPYCENREMFARLVTAQAPRKEGRAA